MYTDGFLKRDGSDGKGRVGFIAAFMREGVVLREMWEWAGKGRVCHRSWQKD